MTTLSSFIVALFLLGFSCSSRSESCVGKCSESGGSFRDRKSIFQRARVCLCPQQVTSVCRCLSAITRLCWSSGTAGANTRPSVRCSSQLKEHRRSRYTSCRG